MSSQWYVNDSGREIGPLSSSELRRLAREGRIRPDSWLRQAGQGGWMPASRVKGLFDAPSEPVPLQPWAPPPAPITTAPFAGLPPAYPQEPPPPPAHFHQPAAPPPPPAYFAQPAMPAPPPRKRPPQGGSSFPIWLVIGGGAGVVLLGLLTVGAVIFLFGRKSRVKVPLNTEQIVARSERSVATIKGKLGGGSGFVVRPGVVATNAHVIGMEFVENLTVQFPSAEGKQREAKVSAVIYSDPRRDIALLRVKTSIEPLPLAERYEFRRGQSIVVIGNPAVGGATLSNAVSQGVMSSETTLNGLPYYQMSVAINPGNSGGPVFNTYGEVIGVATAKAKDKEGLAFCVPVEDLLKGLDEVKNYGPADDARADARHRARTTVLLLQTVCTIYDVGLQEYIKGMEKASANKVDINLGLRDVQSKIGKEVTTLNTVLTTDVKPNINRLGSDAGLNDKMRDNIIELWTTYTELQSYFDNPRGTLGSFRTKRLELSDRYKRLCTALRASLGVT